MPKVELIIFDCDGVLVDSEYLAAKISSELLTQIGYPISPEDLAERYAGLVFTDILKAIEPAYGKPISLQLVDRVEEEFRTRMHHELHAIDGISQALISIMAHYPYCICSNSQQQSIHTMLRIVGLADLFTTARLFSAPEVGSKRPKPAPDVYLFAAKQMGVPPAHCVVVEDSVYGVRSAVTAGMRVIGFTGGRHSYPGHAEVLSQAGAETTISHHKNLSPTIEAMAAWQNV